MTSTETHIPLIQSTITHSNNNQISKNPPGFVDDDIPTLRRRRSSSIGISTEETVAPAMQVFGCINEDGLGCLSWWQE